LITFQNSQNQSGWYLTFSILLADIHTKSPEFKGQNWEISLTDNSDDGGQTPTSSIVEKLYENSFKFKEVSLYTSPYDKIIRSLTLGVNDN